MLLLPSGLITCVVVVVFAVLSSVDAADTLRHRVAAVKDRNVINTKEKAKEMLQRYGYLRCKIAHRRKHASTSTTTTAVPLPSTDSTAARSSKFCTPKEVREAVRIYQRHYNVRVSGRLDKATLKLMSASRCGNPDDEVGVRPSEVPVDTERHARNRRSAAADLMRILTRGRKVPLPSYGDTASRRKKWVESYMARLRSGVVDRELAEQHAEMMARRSKRSSDNNLHAIAKDVISWRLVNSAYSKQMTSEMQRTALALAFRMWSEVIPRVFYEDTVSPVDQVDILIAFGRGRHMNCLNNFDGYGGQLSHAIRKYDGAEIHVDDDEFFTIGSDHGTNFLKVAVHEVGHVLGLIHVQQNYSIMYAIYSERLPNSNFELGWEDRKLVQSIYGICKGAFDTVFDWVRRRPDGQLIYNTYFFRNNHYWMYENRYNRTRYGDPLTIKLEWKGVPADVDGYLHIWTNTQDTALFFKGPMYWKYDSILDEVSPGFPRIFSKDFGPMSNGSNVTLPDSIDTAYFDKRDDKIYFFKNDMVYAYDPEKGNEGCCLPGYPRNIRDEFPADADSDPLPSELDAVYYSYTERSVYFFKGKYYWQNVAFDPLDRRRTNVIKGPWFIHDKWYDICDA